MDQEDINKRIAAAMGSFDGMSRATPAPYLLTRIHARMNADAAPNFWSKAGALLSRPKVAGAGLAVFVLINILVVNSLGTRNTSASLSNQVTQGTKYDFAINVSSIYDIENQEP